MLYRGLGGVKRISLTEPRFAYGHLYKVRARFNLPGRRLGLGYDLNAARERAFLATALLAALPFCAALSVIQIPPDR